MARLPKTPLWMYAVAVVIGFAIGIALALWLVRSTPLLSSGLWPFLSFTEPDLAQSQGEPRIQDEV